ncbi:hypothetical protein NDU88_001935 [Pleurodeles waltl]|uniref:Uncharacterized protein n=1 Tax=Pleurodeles waltl TaxID=8319 RepID=A0AAV7RBT2_PLEWA|nr:hypothetical protein NDU88_001935 [Pleurodeles waltl]
MLGEDVPDEKGGTKSGDREVEEETSGSWRTKGKKGGGTPGARGRNEEATLEVRPWMCGEEQDTEAVREEKAAIPVEEDE